VLAKSFPIENFFLSLNRVQYYRSENFAGLL
jgi:hypothetical protein